MSYYTDNREKISVGIVHGIRLSHSVDRWIESQCEAVAKGGAVTQWVDPNHMASNPTIRQSIPTQSKPHKTP